MQDKRCRIHDVLGENILPVEVVFLCGKFSFSLIKNGLFRNTKILQDHLIWIMNKKNRG